MKTIRIFYIGLLAQAIAATAQVPSLLNYQGYLQDAAGNPATGTVNIAIALYTNASGGTAVYSENIGAASLDKGIYSFNWGASGTSVVSATEIMATTDGSSTLYSYTVSAAPINNPSVTIGDGTYSWNDVSGSSSPANFIGNVSSYATGTVSAIYLSGAPPAGRIISIKYTYSSKGIGSALNSFTNLFAALEINGTPLVPRQLIVSVPYAFMADSAKGIPELQSEQISQSDRLDFLELKNEAMSAESQGYFNPSGSQGVMVQNDNINIASEAFSSTNGFRNRVISSTVGSYHTNRFVTVSYVSNNATVSVAGSTWSMVKQISVNAPAHSVQNDIVGTWYGTGFYAASYIQFVYTDSTTNTTAAQANTGGSELTITHLNPYPNKHVSLVRVYLQGNSMNTAYENDTTVRMSGSNAVVISLSGKFTNAISHSMLAVRGAREGNDNIYYSISDGAHTDSNLALNVKNPIVSLTGAPTRYTIYMQSSTQTNATWAGTAISASALRVWPTE